jgi:hypothetical protein
MSEMLERLRVAEAARPATEPQVWKAYDYLVHQIVWDRDERGENRSLIEAYILQGELQRAIAARGWISEQKSSLCDGGLYIAYIFPTLEDYQKDVDDLSINYRAMNGDTHVAALLAAYLEAVE